MMNLTGMDPAGVLVIDRARKILFTNTRARELLGGDAGLDERRNTLRGASAALERQLFAALDPAAIVGSKVVPQAFMYLPRPRRMPLLAAVTALPEEAAEGLGALVLVWDPAVMPALPAHVLMHLFRLTHAEALTALALYDGQSPSQIAQQRQRSVHTVRSLLARVFMKCGVKRQAELVRLLAGVLHAASLAEGVKIGMGVQRAMDAHPHDPQAFARIQYFHPGRRRPFTGTRTAMRSYACCAAPLRRNSRTGQPPPRAPAKPSTSAASGCTAAAIVAKPTRRCWRSTSPNAVGHFAWICHNRAP